MGKTTKEKITKETVLEEVLKIKGAEDVLERFGLPCLHCPMAKMEIGFLKLGEVCERYGIKAEEVVKELNKL